MATLCRNCGGPLVFKPELNKLFCGKCGSTCRAEEIDNSEKDYLEDIEAVPMKEVYGYEDPDFVDRNIYICENCGGEVVVTDTEASTYCIYCGNPTVVFSRVTKQRRPEFIMPFSTTEDEILNLVRNRIQRGFFIPPSLKKVKIEKIRGIYIPYNIVNCRHHDAVILRGTVKSGNRKRTEYFQRAGSCEFKNIPLDASVKLNDESSSRLEPYFLENLKVFNEDYLSGFYSDIPDVTKLDIKRAASKRCNEMFLEETQKSIAAQDVQVVANIPHTVVADDPVYAMLPAWFVTFEYKKKPHTVLVNGDTGKVVCALPWSEPLFFVLTTLLALVIAAGAAFILYFLFATMFSSHNSSRNDGKLLGLFIAGGITAFSLGWKKYKNVMAKMKLTQSARTMNFVKRRQG